MLMECYRRYNRRMLARWNASGMPGMNAGPRAGTAENPVGGSPPGIVSAQEAFGDVGTLPSPDPALMPRQTISPQQQSGNGCKSCGAELRPNSKFCTKCGAKV